jgi:hypothetical protein
MNENVNKFINSVQQQDYTTAKDEFQAAMAEKINSAFENKKIELASQMAEGTQINEGAYDIPWTEDSWDKNIKKWERKYKVTIKTRDDNATVSGKDSDIEKFLTKELDFEEQDLEMIGLKESVQLDEKKSRQLKDPDTETMVVKDGKVEVIDKKDVKAYMKKGYELAEDTDDA